MRATLPHAPAWILSLLLVQAPVGVFAQGIADQVPDPVRSQPFSLSIRNIMRAEEHVGRSPTDVRWTDDSRWVYFRWQPGGLEWNEGRSLYRVPSAGGEPELLDEETERIVAPLIATGDVSSDRRWRASAVDGDLYLVDRETLGVRRLTQTEDAESGSIFAQDDASVLFRRESNLFRFDLASGMLTQITHISIGSEPEDDASPEGQKAFLERQQLELFEHIRRDEERNEQRDSVRDALAASEPSTTYVDEGARVQSLQPTRSADYVLLRTANTTQESRETIVPDWVTADGYTRDLETRSKVGDEQGSSRIGMVRTRTGETLWIPVTPADYEADSPARIVSSGWNDAGTVAFVFAASFDDKDRWLWSIRPDTGERTLVDHLHDDSWVAGPCFSMCVGFVPDSERIYFVSEETGFAHLYTVGPDGSDRHAVTSGAWEVLDVDLPDDRSRFLLRTNEGSPFDEHAYWVSFDGAARQPITRGAGRYVAAPSPDGQSWAFVHDVSNSPPELFLADADTPGRLERVTETPTEEWSSFPWIEPEIVHVQARDGTSVPARIYRPSDMGAEASGAGILFVHGSGYLHNVHNYWSSYYREYQFNQLLAASGYAVLDIDYRGSAGYGAEWRTSIFRHMGGTDLSDNVDGARYLVENEGVDAGRIGLYGGSYGGFITLMGLFTAGDTFKSGAALRPVTDWAHYNHGYTSRILNLPQDDAEAYERSSPIYFAENLRPDQHLLLLHGMVDTNVHFSDTVRLVQRLIELGKENWDLAAYPVENHGFVEPTSWTDEYRRIFELFERTLRAPN
jgi:dipeptidyl aminopeptidase/acylaminoacyl peptidase